MSSVGQRPPRPEHAPVPCGLPAVDAWTVYDYAEGSPRWVEAFPYCRFHEQSAHADARQAAARTGPRASVYPANYAAGQSRVACRGKRNPVQLGEALDRERITKAADAVRAAARELTALTTTAAGGSFEIGNEGAVLQELLELVTDVEEEAGVVARRLSSRHPGRWFRVAEFAGSIRPTDSPAARLSVATSLWRRWGGGIDDDVPPTLEGGAD